MSFWKESVFTIAELSKAIVANAQSIIAKLENNTNGLGAIKTGVDGANSALGDSTNGLAAIKSAIDAIGSGGSSAIKSIQKVTTTSTSTGSNIPATRAFTINSVDPSKSIVINNQSICNTYSMYQFTEQYAEVTANNTLTEHASGYLTGSRWDYNYSATQYTIIEFN